MEGVVPQTPLRHPRQIGCLDRTAERRGLTETGVIDQHQQDVRSTLRRLHITDQTPVGSRIGQGTTATASERTIRDREPRTINALHIRHQRAFPKSVPRVAPNDRTISAITSVSPAARSGAARSEARTRGAEGTASGASRLD